MANDVKVIVLRTAGTNCDAETVFAFESVGAAVSLVHVEQLFHRERSLADYHILAIPGGFTYGDDIISGRILANELRLRLGEDVVRFLADGKLVIGICNGFQVLVRSGILTGPLKEGESWRPDFEQYATLTYNDSGKFEDRWVHLKASGKSVWTRDLDEIIYVPVAHGEGKFVARDEAVLAQLKKNGQVVFRYCDEKGQSAGYPENPNGSIDDIAGICDRTGRVLGLMPHPERHFFAQQHPAWTRMPRADSPRAGGTQAASSRGQGRKIFENGVNYVKKNLL